MLCSAAGDVENYRKDGSLALCVCEGNDPMDFCNVLLRSAWDPFKSTAARILMRAETRTHHTSPPDLPPAFRPSPNRAQNLSSPLSVCSPVCLEDSVSLQISQGLVHYQTTKTSNLPRIKAPKSERWVIPVCCL